MKAPMIRLIFPFILGIILGSMFPFGNALALGVACGVLLCAMFYLAYFRLKQTLWYPFVFFLSFALAGFSLASLDSPQRNPDDFSHFVGEDNWLEVVVKEMPTQSTNTMKAMVEVTRIGDSAGWHESSGKMMVFFRKDSLAYGLHYGDRLLVRGSPHEVSAPQNPYQFDYRKYLERKGICHQLYLTSEQYRVLESSSEHGIHALAYRLRAKMIDIIKNSGLSEKEQGIASALLLGWDEDIDAETLQSFSNAGIAHFLSVSGLHLGIIFLFIGYLLFWLGNTRRSRIIKGCIQLAVLWFFAMMTGLAPSILRAATMFSLISIGEMFFTRASFYNNIASSAFFLLCFNPFMLFDVGFQLSYLGVLGIVILQPGIKNLIAIPTGLDFVKILQNSWNKDVTSKIARFFVRLLQYVTNAVLWILAKVWELSCVSIAAQIVTLPLTFYYFHQFPVYFLIANVSIIPFAGFLLATVIFVVAFSWVPVVGAWIVKLLSLEMSAMTWVISFVEKLPNSTFSDFYFDEAMMLLTALFILGYAIAFVRRKKWALFSAMALSIVFVAYVGQVAYAKSGQRKWIAYSTRNHLVMEFVNGNTSYLVSDSAVISDPKTVEFSTQGYQLRNQTEKRVNVILHDTYKDSAFFLQDKFGAFGNEKFVIVTPENCKTKSKFVPTVDYLILSGNPRIKNIADMQNKYRFGKVIIASDNSRYRAGKWQAQCDSLKIACHNIVADGAFEKRIKY